MKYFFLTDMGECYCLMHIPSHFYFSKSMLSVIDELCIMTVYINVCSFHWILFNIHVDTGAVDLMDSMFKEQEDYTLIISALKK